MDGSKTGTSRNAIWRYCVAVGATGVAFGITWGIESYVDRGIMSLFFASVVVSTWYGGLGPGLLATVLSVLACQFFFFEPRYSLAVRSIVDIGQLIVFGAVSLLINVLHVARERAEERLKELNESLENRVRERTVWLDLISDVARAANEAQTLGEVFHFAAERICRDGTWSYCHVLSADKDDPLKLAPSPVFHVQAGPGLGPLSDLISKLQFRKGEGLAGRVYESGRSEWIDDPNADPVFARAGALLDSGFKSMMGFPVKVGRETTAVFLCFSDRPAGKDGKLLGLMSAVGMELGRSVERSRLQQEYVDAIWRQWKQIAHDLHDGLGQELTGVGFLARALADAEKGTDESGIADKVTEGIGRALEQIRRLARGVQPVELQAEGLMSALAQLAADTQSACAISCRFECPRPVLIKEHKTALHLFRIAQEAVTNAVKHGHPESVVLALEAIGTEIRLTVRDDGVGIGNSGENGTGSGLRIMRYGAAALGATFRIERAGETGTVVTVALPTPNRQVWV